MSSWIETEFASLNLGDKRRECRAKRMIQQMADRPTGSIPRTFETVAEAKAAYRFLSNPDVEPEAIRDAIVKACAERLGEEEIVFVMQDTTSLDFSTHEAAEGLGPLGGGDGSAGHGMLVHSAIAVSNDGVPLGLVHQKVWTRDPEAIGSARARRKRPIEDKESFRWIETLQACEKAVPDDCKMVTIADREADIFELFAAPGRDGSHVLVRASHNRRVDEAEYLLEAIEAAPEAGRFTVNLGRGTERRPREAELSVRFQEFTAQVPRHGVHAADLEPVELTAILAEETSPPSDATPVRWLLLTDLPVTCFDDACECVHRYTLRWLIERYHYVLKSGCGIEDSQLRSADALECLLALYCVVALRLLWLTYTSRTDGDAPCTVAFTDVEWKALFRRHDSQSPMPKQPLTLREAVRLTARLGGFLDRKSDGDPGVKTLWQGLMRLQDIVIGVLLYQGDVGNV
jgi:hypothetical protein